ncbi:MAG: hypothetical protein QOI25_2434 [Mycobacterium sp.]|jgi:hypothetical protein|nr:hypothetical protein [Mycobacterium sp.]MDT5323571.1 hypothetical protein [Mycobacterium sp.]
MKYLPHTYLLQLQYTGFARDSAIAFGIIAEITSDPAKSAKLVDGSGSAWSADEQPPPSTEIVHPVMAARVGSGQEDRGAADVLLGISGTTDR